MSRSRPGWVNNHKTFFSLSEETAQSCDKSSGMLGNPGRVVKSLSLAGEITQLDPPSSHCPTHLHWLLIVFFTFCSCLRRNEEVKVSWEAWGGGRAGVDLPSISNAASFSSEEVCADPLLGLTHLEGLGGGLPLVCLTVANCLTGVNVMEWSKSWLVPPSLDEWGALAANSSVTMKEFTAREKNKQKKKSMSWGDLFLPPLSFHSNVNCGCSSLKGLPEQRRCDQAMFWMLSTVAIGKHLSPPLNTRRLRMGLVNNTF